MPTSAVLVKALLHGFDTTLSGGPVRLARVSELSDGAAFHRKMHEKISETTPHLVYADWLEENGHPHLAEVIRKSIDAGDVPGHMTNTPELIRATVRGQTGPELEPGEYRIAAAGNVSRGQHDLVVRQRSLADPSTHFRWTLPGVPNEEAKRLTKGVVADGGHVPSIILNRLAGILLTDHIERSLAAARHTRPIGLARPAEGLHIGFVSPSQREGSKYAEAARELQNPKELALLRKVALTMPGIVGGTSGIGFWKDGAEESHMLRGTTPDAVIKATAMLGKQFRQKSVVTFTEDPSGTDAAHILKVQGDPEKIHEDLLRHGVEYKTVIPGRHGNTVFVLDSGAADTPKVQAYAAETRSPLKQLKGHVTFIGADDRESAQHEYDKWIGGQARTPGQAPPG